MNGLSTILSRFERFRKFSRGYQIRKRTVDLLIKGQKVIAIQLITYPRSGTVVKTAYGLVHAVHEEHVEIALTGESTGETKIRKFDEVGNVIRSHRFNGECMIFPVTRDNENTLELIRSYQGELAKENKLVQARFVVERALAELQGDSEKWIEVEKALKGIIL